MLAPAQRRRLLVVWLRRAAVVAAACGVLAAVAYVLWPSAIPVDIAKVTVGPLVVAVRDEGRTRIKDRYIVSSPLSGRVTRIDLRPGDHVVRGQTVLATIEPADPSLLDARALAQTRANVKAAEANRQRASAELERTVAALERAQSQFRRVKTLRETGSASPDELEDAEMMLRQTTQQHEAAKFNVSIAEFEQEQAKAALLRFQPQDVDDGQSKPDDGWRMEIRSPITGQILRVLQQSSAVLTSGTPLVEVGDPADLEVEVDVLSEDAVKVRPGNPVHIEQWGGGKRLEGVVRTIEPRAFTKVSALGVEEQRVNIIIDFTGPKEERATLGDGYRVEAAIVIWEDAAVLKVPISALFRKDDRWVAFVVENGRARLRPIELGRRNSLDALVVVGLKADESVILHPSDDIQQGARVTRRD